MTDAERLPVGIVGASGYGGVQLVHLLQSHPQVEIAYLGGESSAGKPYSSIYPHLEPFVELSIEAIDIEQIAQKCRVVFLSMPNGLAWKMAPELLAKGCKVLDLSADYRFANLEIYRKWYGGDRTDQATVAGAVYGLPELYRDRIAEASLIGCPGCYVTASLLALAPLLKQGLIASDSAIVDAKSGTSGGGRKTETHLLHAEAEGSLSAYGVGGHHRHTPEIEEICSDLVGHEIRVQFTPHLIPMIRGILATVYGKLRDPGLVREDLVTIYRAFYRNSPWVKVLSGGNFPKTKWVTGTNLCYIGVEVDQRTDRVIVLSTIDNLLKGQSGQAVQCLNLMMGWDETLGLPQMSFYP
ncbi:MAG: N-acetyl-gamma-glutamyl-phosphate reductase [Microcoleaceae cyanobacterium]